MSSRTAFQPKNNSRNNDSARHTCEDLIRLLVKQVGESGAEDVTAGRRSDEFEKEEILLEVDFAGSHYLLIRLAGHSNHPHVQLSPREQEIVRMVAKGHPNKVIADVLNISSWTVCTHLRRIFAKLGVSSRAAMVAKMLEEGRHWEQIVAGEKSPEALIISDRPSHSTRMYIRKQSA